MLGSDISAKYGGVAAQTMPPAKPPSNLPTYIIQTFAALLKEKKNKIDV
jgi:hypothetical protein